MQRPDLARVLLALLVEDERVRARLAAEGTLFDGYHAEMEAVHRANAARLRAVMDEVGWPVAPLVGGEAADAAWTVAQHAIGEPAFQREVLGLVERAVAAGEAPAWQAAYLEDRIRAFEGRPQRYGTQYDWDDDGHLSPWPPVEDPEGVDARRAAVGLGPLAANTERMRASVRAAGEGPPPDPAARRREAEAWARRVGWRTQHGD